MKNRNLLVFDFDGVLVDNTVLGYQETNQIFAELGLPPIPTNFLRKHWGKQADDLALAFCGYHRQATDENLAYFKNRFREINIGATLDKDLFGSLISLPAFGFFTGIITSRGKADLKKYAEEIGLDLSIFYYIQTIDDHLCHKPNGHVFDPLIHWAGCRNLTPDKIAYFGDTINYDYAAVKNSRKPIKFIGVCSGVNTYQEFEDAGLEETEIISSHDVLSFYLTRLIQEKAASRVGVRKVASSR